MVIKENNSWNWCYGQLEQPKQDEVAVKVVGSIPLASTVTSWMSCCKVAVKPQYGYMGEGIQEWTEKNLCEAAFKKFEVIWYI